MDKNFKIIESFINACNWGSSDYRQSIREALDNIKGRLLEYEKFYPIKHQAHMQLMDRYNEACAEIIRLENKLKEKEK